LKFPYHGFFMSLVFSLIIGISVAGVFVAGLPGWMEWLGRMRRPGASPTEVSDHVPGWWGRLVATRRLARLRAQLPEGLGTLSTSVRAGLSLPQALAQGADSIPPPLGEELRRMTRETALGGTLEASLAGFERRAPLPEIHLLVAALNLARTTGGSLAPLLDQLTDTLRERERLRGHVKTLTAQGRLSGWVVGLMPVVLLVVVSAVDPEFLSPLLHTPAGLVLLGVAVVLEVIGAVAIRAVVRVEP
jgi:tight adherence protein B